MWNMRLVPASERSPNAKCQHAVADMMPAEEPLLETPAAKGRKAGSVCGGAAGLADSLVGAVTLFWVAVLQRRAFAMKFGAFGAYEWAFDQPHINWTW